MTTLQRKHHRLQCFLEENFEQLHKATWPRQGKGRILSVIVPLESPTMQLAYKSSLFYPFQDPDRCTLVNYSVLACSGYYHRTIIEQYTFISCGSRSWEVQSQANNTVFFWASALFLVYRWPHFHCILLIRTLISFGSSPPSRLKHLPNTLP